MFIESLTSQSGSALFPELSRLLTECVQGGASIGFLAPLSETDAASYWRKVVGEIDGGFRTILVARAAPAAEVTASAQIVFESRANGRHRAEIQKVMVRPAYRRRGIAAALMTELELRATERGTRLLFLDTSDGHGGARGFYDALGYVYVGGIPGYALDPDGKPAKNAIYYKTLET